MLQAETYSPIEAVRHETGEAAKRIGLREVRQSSKVGFKGSGVETWLAEMNVAYPPRVYDVLRPDDQTIIARTGTDEVMIESAARSGIYDAVAHAAIDRHVRLCRIEQQAVTLLLGGEYADAIWSQTCGVYLAKEPVDRVVYTRVAGVSCAIIPEPSAKHRQYRIWVDYSYAPYVWSTFIEVAGCLVC